MAQPSEVPSPGHPGQRRVTEGCHGTRTRASASRRQRMAERLERQRLTRSAMSIFHTPTRRAALHAIVGGSLARPAILSELLAAEARRDNPLAPKKPHFEPKAKRVIFLFSTGGVSHLDTFDPKERIIKA